MPREHPSGEIFVGDRLEKIEQKLDTIIESLGDSKTRLALIEQKIKLHDKILMGAFSVIGLTVLGAVLAKVVV